MVKVPSTPREIAIHGVYIPTLTLSFVVATVFTWGLDRIFILLGLYCFTWHPALFRVGLFVCLYGGLPLIIYR